MSKWLPFLLINNPWTGLIMMKWSKNKWIISINYAVLKWTKSYYCFGGWWIILMIISIWTRLTIIDWYTWHFLCWKLFRWVFSYIFCLLNISIMWNVIWYVVLNGVICFICLSISLVIIIEMTCTLLYHIIIRLIFILMFTNIF